MNNVLINNKDLEAEYGAYVASVQIGAPSPKTSYVDVPYADGKLDLSDYFGGIKYENRVITITCLILNNITQTHSAILQAFHGKTENIVLAADPEYIYTGRISVGGVRATKAGTFEIVCDCKPYKKHKTTGAEVL